MNILLGLLILALLGVASVGRKSPSKLVIGAGILLCAGILGVSTVILTRSAQSPAHTLTLDRTFETAAGYRIGTTLARRFPGDSEFQVLVLNVPWDLIPNRKKREAYESGLRKGLEETSARVVLAPAEIETEVYRGLMGQRGRSVLDAVQSSLASSGDVDAVISFMSLPDNPAKEILRGLPPIYVVQSSLSPTLLGLVRTGTIAGMVVFNPDTDWLADADPQATLDEVFDSRYQFLASPVE